MTLRSLKFSRRAWLVATALMLAMPTTASQAYTFEEQEMCTGDAMRLCFSEIPDEARITACMERHIESLSPGCRALFKPTATAAPPAAVTARAQNKPAAKPSKPVTITPKPKHD
jgi:hypothetical protein